MRITKQIRITPDDDLPAPGSDAAIDTGCTCPVLDNNHGRGAYVVDGHPVYWQDATCPVHGLPTIGEQHNSV